MTLLLPLFGIVLCWAWATGRLRRFRWRNVRWADVAAVLAAIMGARLLRNGELLPALVGFGWAAGWLWFGRRALPGRRRAAPVMPLDEARGLLAVSPVADAAAIRAAHRRLIVRVHPDAGGSAELARRVNLARDALLAELNHPDRASRA